MKRIEYKTLPVKEELSATSTLVTKDNIDIIYIDHPIFTAAISLFGAHVLSFTPKNENEDWLWLSKEHNYNGRDPLRGGIPICWPWFSRIALPNHGFARTSNWQLTQFEENKTGIKIRLSLSDNESTRSIWPHRFKLDLDIELNDSLNVNLSVHNTDTHAWPFSGALHSYYSTSDITAVDIQGAGLHYLDKFQELKNVNCNGIRKIDGPMDRVYHSPTPVISLTDSKYHRKLNITNIGHNCAVIWNPWIELSQEFEDMGNDDYKRMVCVESTIFAQRIEEGIMLNAGERYQLGTMIASSIVA
ncbi:D-hexose-6-phosphate mutarotase [Vibrio sp.]|nr:D-hexose-6-phosphate mutarotase [Vibrio sp.]